MIDPSFSKRPTSRPLSGANLSAEAHIAAREQYERSILEERRAVAAELDLRRPVRPMTDVARVTKGASDAEVMGASSVAPPSPVEPVAPTPPVAATLSSPTPRPIDIIAPAAVATSAISPEHATIAEILSVEEEEVSEESAPVVTSSSVEAAAEGVKNGIDKKAEKKEKKAKRKGFFRKASWYTAGAIGAVMVLALSGYVGIDTWVTNNRAKMVMAEDQVSSTGFSVSNLPGEGEDENEILIDTINSYAVAPELPRILSIDKLDLRARILPMSLNADGAIQAPININDSGWYTGSSKPGETGAMFIDAHASGATRMGLFAYLDTLVQGDTVTVEKGDGTSVSYRVVHVEEKPMDDIDMAEVLKPYGGSGEGLNLMTCTGAWLKDKQTYDKRVIVYTKRI